MVPDLFNNDCLSSDDKGKYFVQPGYIFVSKEPYLLSTVLGSCISVCIWDPAQGFGGMNHYIHARPFNKERTAHYGTVSIPHLIRTMIKSGSKQASLKAHIVGGAQNPRMGSAIIGQQNIQVAETLLREYFIDIVTFDTGGQLGRKVVFDTESGEIAVYKVNKLREEDWYADKSTNRR